MFLDFYYAGIGMEMKWRRTMTHFGGKAMRLLERGRGEGKEMMI
jgi:hypothetical protein